MVRQSLRSFSISVAVIGLLAIFAPCASAQATAPKVELAGGYSTLHDNDLSENFSTGWFISAGENMSEWFGVVGELSGNYKTVSVLGTDVNLSVHSFMAGPKFAARQQKQVTPFGQVLFGAARASGGILGQSVSETDFAVQPGAGIDIALRREWAVRLGANERFIRSEGETSKEFQFVAGVVFRP